MNTHAHARQSRSPRAAAAGHSILPHHAYTIDRARAISGGDFCAATCTFARAEMNLGDPRSLW